MLPHFLHYINNSHPTFTQPEDNFEKLSFFFLDCHFLYSKNTYKIVSVCLFWFLGWELRMRDLSLLCKLKGGVAWRDNVSFRWPDLGPIGYNRTYGRHDRSIHVHAIYAKPNRRWGELQSVSRILARWPLIKSIHLHAVVQGGGGGGAQSPPPPPPRPPPTPSINLFCKRLVWPLWPFSLKVMESMLEQVINGSNSWLGDWTLINPSTLHLWPAQGAIGDRPNRICDMQFTLNLYGSILNCS